MGGSSILDQSIKSSKAPASSPPSSANSSSATRLPAGVSLRCVVRCPPARFNRFTRPILSSRRQSLCAETRSAPVSGRPNHAARFIATVPRSVTRRCDEHRRAEVGKLASPPAFRHVISPRKSRRIPATISSCCRVSCMPFLTSFLHALLQCALLATNKNTTPDCSRRGSRNPLLAEYLWRFRRVIILL